MAPRISTSSRRRSHGQSIVAGIVILAVALAGHLGLSFITAPKQLNLPARVMAPAGSLVTALAPLAASAASDEAQLRKIDGEEVDPVLVNVGLGVGSLLVFIVLPGVIASLFTNSAKFKVDDTDEEGREYK
mmetsp:Transcript_9275/g.20780  ORF Transcript_9275/g.20780 Transcript_9275/m.20780 type:complete len:131 (-) Transcript_9275:152-544(-)|eukprot:CAMPEP_0178431634 /NCGR_PEP_ID=MMETSP0689_2-20121128/31957_1 /TAXON_ID=160604 /ORGANISM="Amphidinium massartii, Strain CS-259" /LENGTH=130 /DNA_ID=CAMNT_0020053569 /DNA_START=83 /DNA_END=475 /DNA_ORIENTATION=+